MVSTEILLSVAAALIVFYAFKKWLELKDTPPGPWGVPILGYLPFLMFTDPISLFIKFKEKYGKIFSIRIGNFNCIVINDYNLIHEAYKDEVFLGRPPFEVHLTRCHGKQRGLLFSYGKTWEEQRRFALRNLRNFGFGKHSMESLLQHEAIELGNFFAENAGKPISLKSRFNGSVLNSLWVICTGSRFELDDPDFQFLITNLIDNMQKADSTGLVFFFPWVLKKDLLIKGFWDNFIRTRDKIQSMIRNSIAEHEKTFNPLEIRDFVDALIDQKRKTDDPNSSFYGAEGDLNMLITLLDLFVAGAETSSSIMQWAMLYMMMWPEIQTKVQNEIDAVIGTRMPTLDDRPNLIYTEATLCEIHRFTAMVPLSVYHGTTAETHFGGYRIPKDVVVFANIREAHHNKEYWGDPENFRPERFIEENGNKIIKHKAYMPFSAGKRVCLGESLAKDTFFLFFTYLIQKFRVAKDPNGPELSLKPNARTFIISPKPYQIVVTPRQI